MSDLTTTPIVGIVVGCLVVVAVPLWIVYSYFGSRRAVSNLLGKVGGALGVAPASATIWAERRNLVGVAAEPVAQGQHRGIPVELTYSPKAGTVMEKATTRITLVWPKVVGHAGLDRNEVLSDPSAAGLPSPLNQPVTRGEVNLRWKKDTRLGPATIWGTDADLDRLFGSTNRATLKALSRTLSVVFVDDRMVMEWLGLEDDPAIVRRAFDAGIACLEYLAPR